nr:MAG TPA: hypothetical protein [Caudoviricetes sp.]
MLNPVYQLSYLVEPNYASTSEIGFEASGSFCGETILPKWCNWVTNVVTSLERV